jgi:hypothetical protein
MHSALTGVQVLVQALHSMPIVWLIFCWGLLIVTAEKGKRQKYHIQMLVHWLLFSGTMKQKRKNVKKSRRSIGLSD